MMINSDIYMWDDPENRVKPELGPGERILWAGKPQSGIIIRGTDAFLIPFSLMWGGFAIFWETMVILQGAPFFFIIFGLPFVLVGLYLIFGRFWIDAWQRTKTFYGITNERVIIISGLFRPSTKSINIDALTDLSLTEKSNGTGSISLEPINPWYGSFGNSSWPRFGQYMTPSLDLIENARNVYDIIRNAQRKVRNDIR